MYETIAYYLAELSFYLATDDEDGTSIRDRFASWLYDASVYFYNK